LSCVAGDEPCQSSLGDADTNCDGIDDRDVDGDGAVSAALGGDDCDDSDALLNPHDDDLDTWSTCEGDCDDADPARGARGEAVEECDDIDNDCNGVVDEDDLGHSACERTDLFEQPVRVLLDLMLVLDDSGSMTDELALLGLGGPDLLGPLAGTDTHVGVVSNDIEGHGRMHGSVGGPPWLDLTTVTESQAFAWFSGATALTTEGTHLARGLDVAMEAIDVSGDTWNVGFRRPDAPLVILFVADRDDESVADEDEFLLWLAGTVTARGEAGRVHSIVPTSAEVCPGTTGEAVAYTSLATATGGQTVSVCDESYAEELAIVGAAEQPAHDVVLLLGLTPIPATLSVDILTTEGVTDVLPAEAVEYEPFANTVAIEAFSWSELESATVHYLVLPEELVSSR
jgi:hypothetical protein